MYKIFALVVLVLLAPLSWAISNIENERPSLPEEGVSGNAKIGFAGKTGDEQKQSYEVSVKTFYRQGDEIFMLLGSKEYGSTQKIKDTDNSFLHGRWTHLLDESWAVETFAQWEENEFTNLTSRVLEGGGGRYVITQQKDVYSFIVGVGAFHEVEKVDLVSYQQTNRLWRINSYYSYNYQLNPQLSFFNTTYFQPATDDIGDYRVLFDVGMNVQLIKNLQLTINYRLTNDSRPARNMDVIPPINNHKTNTEYKTGLTFVF